MRPKKRKLAERIVEGAVGALGLGFKVRLKLGIVRIQIQRGRERERESRDGETKR